MVVDFHLIHTSKILFPISDTVISCNSVVTPVCIIRLAIWVSPGNDNSCLKLDVDSRHRSYCLPRKMQKVGASHVMCCEQPMTPLKAQERIFLVTTRPTICRKMSLFSIHTLLKMFLLQSVSECFQSLQSAFPLPWMIG